MSTIAFIGLGNMGLGMAANLAKAGHEVRALDIDPAAIAKSVEAGCVQAANAKDAVAQAESVITMLPAGKHVEMVYAEVMTHARPDTLFIDCSTIDVKTARSVIAAAEEKDFPMIDAPVSGGVGGAAAGTLTFMCGGTNIAFKEAFNLAEKLGLDAQTFYDISSTASGQNWSMTSYCPAPGPIESAPSNRDYQPGFAAAMMLKDLRLAQDAAQSAKAATPLGAQAMALYALMESAGQEGLDFSGVMKLIDGSL